ncbi:CENP-P-like protein Fta2 [Schizosaccharomyces osmophilus]|uniref:CENP-P-like protein Fta2 n=1 Tax=Schizosaccharomyces osmophilus TaxID=2545709 RepID=A0AAE9WF12_9SCHI|nr:CENP-P-like protein Fta2 [Schizosaccharomyces osmophilus]WBW74007.1 CENP-P-like protein Fta2 [Schizosaccharomyces osmophilus]
MTSRRFSQISQEDNSSSEEETPVIKTVGNAELATNFTSKKTRNVEDTPGEEKNTSEPQTWEKKTLLERRNQLYTQISLLEQDVERLHKQASNPDAEKQEHQMLKELVGLFFETPKAEDRQPTKDSGHSIYIPSAAPNINRPVCVSFSGLRILTYQSTDASDIQCIYKFEGFSEFFPSLNFQMNIKVRTADYAVLEMFIMVASFARNELQDVIEKTVNARDVVAALRAVSMFGYYSAIRSNDWVHFINKFDGIARVDLTSTSELHIQNRLYKISLQYNICFDEFGFAKTAYNILFRPKQVPQKSEESISLLTKNIKHRFHELISLFGFRKGSETLLEVLFKPANK